MNFKRLPVVRIIALGGLLNIAPYLPAFQDAPAPDNTKVNQRDRAKSEPTADQARPFRRSAQP